MRSIVALAVKVARVVAVVVRAYSITSLPHHRMAFPLLPQHHVLGTVLLPNRTPCEQTLQGIGAGVRPHGSRETGWLVLLNGLHGRMLLLVLLLRWVMVMITILHQLLIQADGTRHVRQLRQLLKGRTEIPCSPRWRAGTGRYLVLLSMETALRRGDLPILPPSGFSIHQELLPVPSFCTLIKRPKRAKLALSSSTGDAEILIATLQPQTMKRMK
ncbi:hypothetical protein EYF80_000435 [Liparis tanakae]|uniref:Uncharacterized protein n=1 Tax=Liparis tanakae TaxID=230148 RepID=A0A4Z2JGR5_9TELE|nr:hypothetical protein EYF80_000435 [Liparis tanakae]